MLMSQKLKEGKSKSKRRGNNEGTIFQRKDGRWCGQVITGYSAADGKPIRKTVYGSSRQEVAKKVTAQAHEVNDKGYRDVDLSANEVRKLKPAMWEWFDIFEKGRLESQTVYIRRNLMKNHIFTELGDYDIQRITLERLQKFFNGRADLGICQDTIGKIKGLLKRFFTYATDQGYVSKNPMLRVDIKRRHSKAHNDAKSGKALRPEIRKDIFTWLDESPTLKPIIVTFMFTGLRPQELIALKWQHVNLEEKTLSVKKAINRIVEFDGEGEVTSRREGIGKTKTPKSVRTISIPDVVVKALTEWCSWCKEKGIVSEYIFATKDGGLRTYSGLRSLLTRFIKAHGLEDEGISLYTFRHTFATILLEERENDEISSRIRK
jgi:integrase